MDAEVAKRARRVNAYHRKKLIQTLRTALDVDIRLLLDGTAIRFPLDAWRRDNVALIRTIPTRLHEGLLSKMTTTFMDRPFDQQALRQLVAAEGKSSGWNLRRITRDQTNKAVSNLSQARRQQLGIESYVWRTAKDERVRPTHQANDGQTFQWASPPIDTGHPGQDILCRCVAQPVIPEAFGA